MKKVCASLGFLVLVAAVSPAQAVTYSFQTVSLPNNSNGSGAACGINSSGQISGWYQDTASVVHGFIKTGNAFSIIDYPGSTYTIVRNINDAGQVVGYSGLNPFMWSSGSFTPVVVANYNWVGPIGINNFGTISGQYSTTDGLYHGFLQDSAGTTQLNYPGAMAGTTGSGGVNGNGEVVGWYQDASYQQHGFKYSAGVYTTIDFPGQQTVLWGLNDSGVVVGYHYGADPRQPTGFVYANGAFVELTPPGLNKLSQAWSVNNAGVIVGSYGSGSGAWIASPHGP